MKWPTMLLLACALPTSAAVHRGSTVRFGLAIGVLASPIRARFGEKITHELSLDLGTILITSDGRFDPFGRVSYTLFF